MTPEAFCVFLQAGTALYVGLRRGEKPLRSEERGLLKRMLAREEGVGSGSIEPIDALRAEDGAMLFLKLSLEGCEHLSDASAYSKAWSALERFCRRITRGVRPQVQAQSTREVMDELPAGTVRTFDPSRRQSRPTNRTSLRRSERARFASRYAV